MSGHSTRPPSRRAPAHSTRRPPRPPARACSIRSPRRPSATASAAVVSQQAVAAASASGRRRAHARGRQGQLHASRRLQIAGEGGHDRAHLLVPGEHEKRRRPAVALHPDHEEVRLGLAQLLDAVRRHRAAAVHVRVDERRERPRALHRGVEVEAQLAEHGQVRPESRHGDDLVEGAERAALGVEDGHARLRPGGAPGCGTRSRVAPVPHRRAGGAGRPGSRGPGARRPRRRRTSRRRRSGAPPR